VSAQPLVPLITFSQTRARVKNPLCATSTARSPTRAASGSIPTNRTTPNPKKRRITAPLCGPFWTVRKSNLRTMLSSRSSWFTCSTGTASSPDDDMIFYNHPIYSPTGSTKVDNNGTSSDTKKEDPENPQQWHDLPRTLVLTLYQSTSNPQAPNLSWLGPSSCHRSPIYLQLENWQTQQRIIRHNTQLWSYITHRCLWGKNVRSSFMDCIHSLRAQALPSNTILYKNRRRWSSLQFFLSLSLSMSSCSNELDHTSDAAETPDPSQDSLLPSYSPFSFFPPSLLFSSQNKNVPYYQSLPPPFSFQKQTSDLFLFSVGFLHKLVPIFQRRSILPAPSSTLSPS